MGLRTGGRRAKGLKNRVISSKIELRFREVRSEGCTSCSPVQQALILPYYGFYGSASAEPFLFSRSFPADWGARLRISGGCPGGASRMRISNNCSSIAWAAEPPQRCSPVQQALILPYYGFYGSASAEPFLFSRSFPADWGARLRISGGCPGGASRMRISNNCSSIAWAAEPPQRCSPVQQVQQRRL